MRRALVASALGLVLSFVGSAFGHEAQYVAYMSGPAEFPSNASPGTGLGIVTVDFDLATMRVQVDFTGLTGTTTASHIHGLTSAPGFQTAGVMTTTPTFPSFPLGVTSGSYDHTFNLGDASSYNPAFVTAQGSIANAMNTMLGGFETGRTYLNIHTSTFGGGEIRGFLIAIPEPASASIAGVVGLGLLRRRR